MLKSCALICFAILLDSCAASKSPAPQTFAVPSKLWKACWLKCGRGDELLSVDERTCVCKNMGKVEHGQGPVEEPAKEPDPSRSVFEMLGMLPEDD